MENILFLFKGEVNSVFLLTFILGEGSIIFSFFVCLFFSILKEDFDYKKRIVFPFLALSIILFQLGVFAGGKWVVTCFFSLSITVFFSAILFGLGKVKKKNKKCEKASENEDKNGFSEKQIELAKYFDSLRKKEKQSGDNFDTENPIDIKTGIDRAVSNIKTNYSDNIQRETKEPVLDFSHVKNILNRLADYSLTPNDKKQVKELESMLIIAEKGQIDINLKERLNASLGGLLKMMSKYGV